MRTQYFSGENLTINELFLQEIPSLSQQVTPSTGSGSSSVPNTTMPLLSGATNSNVKPVVDLPLQNDVLPIGVTGMEEQPIEETIDKPIVNKINKPDYTNLIVIALGVTSVYLIFSGLKK